MSVCPDGPRRQAIARAFTLVEILIVVVILGILAAIVTPSLVRATDDARLNATLTELHKLERALEVYKVRENTLPDISDGDQPANWGGLVGIAYLKGVPQNPYVGGANSGRIVVGAGPDAAYQQNHGWIFDPVNGEIWAGSFDVDKNPLPN